MEIKSREDLKQFYLKQIKEIQETCQKSAFLEPDAFVLWVANFLLEEVDKAEIQEQQRIEKVIANMTPELLKASIDQCRFRYNRSSNRVSVDLEVSSGLSNELLEEAMGLIVDDPFGVGMEVTELQKWKLKVKDYFDKISLGKASGTPENPPSE